MKKDVSSYSVLPTLKATILSSVSSNEYRPYVITLLPVALVNSVSNVAVAFEDASVSVRELNI